MNRHLVALSFCVFGLLASSLTAQFSGPSVNGRPSTVAEARDARLGTYVTLTGNIVNHLRSDYYTFRDDTGEIRVEIATLVWRGRRVGPEDKVRLVGEIDRGLAGRYVWVKLLDVL